MTYRSRFVCCRCVWFLELFFFFNNKRTWQLDGWRVLSFLFLLSVPEQCCNKANRSRNNSCEKTNRQELLFFPPLSAQFDTEAMCYRPAVTAEGLFAIHLARPLPFSSACGMTRPIGRCHFHEPSNLFKDSDPAVWFLFFHGNNVEGITESFGSFVLRTEGHKDQI